MHMPKFMRQKANRILPAPNNDGMSERYPGEIGTKQAGCNCDLSQRRITWDWNLVNNLNPNFFRTRDSYFPSQCQPRLI